MRVGGFAAIVVVGLAVPLYAGSVSLLAGGEFRQEISTALDVQLPQALPHQSTSSVTAAGGSSWGSYTLDSTRFDLALRQRGSTEGFYSRATGELTFAVNAPTAFQFTNQFAGLGDTIWTGFIDLIDGATGEAIYRRVQFNSVQPLPGVVPGDAVGSNVGSPTGMLEPSREYQLRYILYSMVVSGGGSIVLPDSGDVGLPSGGSTPTGSGIPRPGRLTPGDLTGSIAVVFAPDSVVVPLPPAVLAGGALLVSLGCHRLVAVRRRRRMA